ncbi:monocyte chemotactic protein 1B-like [Lampris incognitus]|uniref:monocyte chemotactic protein 1B-like n=1 Tax=Lampris incognitus TaxID=2546036 RepID=UPI0024B5ED09|nr:monocyte chemotactic protein 1B-like [Lampris incognitus]
MSAPRLALSVLVLVLAAIALSEGMRGTGPKRCCFAFTERQIAKKRVISYTNTSQQCTNRAVLLKVRAGYKLCARPSDPWVMDIISYLQAKSTPGQLTKL